METSKTKQALCGRVFSTLMAAALLLSLAACGGAGAGPQEAAPESAAASVEAIEIEYWYGLGGTLGEAVDAIIQDFNASQDRITVKGVKQSHYDETGQVIQAAVAAGQVPAAFLIDVTQMRSFMNRGLLENLDGYIEGDPDFDKDDIVPSFLMYGEDDSGSLYALPAYGTTHPGFYRKDTFEKLGIDPDEALKSWQSLAEASRTIKDETGMFGWDPMYELWHMIDIVRSAGGTVLSEDEKTVTFDSAEWVEVWDTMRKWINEEEIMKFNFGGDGWEFWYKTMDDVHQGRTAGYTGSSADISDLDFDIVAAHIQPGWKDNEPKPYADAVMNQILAIASEEEKQAGFEWISYFSSTRANARYSILSGYVPVRLSCADDPDFQKYVEEVPAMGLALDQVAIAAPSFIDMTGGKIKQALWDAYDLVLIENVPAAEALGQAKVTAQAALDEYWASQEP